MAKRTRKTPKEDENWYAQFLDVLSRTGNVRLSAYKANVPRSVVYHHYDINPSFAERWDDATDDAADRLEQEARRRAVNGINRPIYYQGERIDIVKEYSDSLLMFLLKGVRPEKYRDNYDLVKFANDIANARTSDPQPPAKNKASGPKDGRKG